MRGERTSEKIKSTAAYTTAAVLLIVLTFLSRNLDGAYFADKAPLKPVEFTLEALFIAAAAVFIARHRGKELFKKILKYSPFVFIPLAVVFAAFFYLPDKTAASDHGFIYALDILLSAFSADFILCSVGCILLLHKSRMKIAGVAVMLAAMLTYELVMAHEHAHISVIYVIAALIIGYFEIQLHMITDSAVFCATFNFLMYMAMYYTKLVSQQPEPYFGKTVSNILYGTALFLLLGFGIYLNKKRRFK